MEGGRSGGMGGWGGRGQGDTDYERGKQRCKYTTLVGIQNRATVTHLEPQEHTESVQEQRTALYKSDQSITIDYGTVNMY